MVHIHKAMCGKATLSDRTKNFPLVRLRLNQNQTTMKISLRTNPKNPNHHLWNNHGTWYIHYVVHPTVNTKDRIRRSLQTKSIAKARRERDAILDFSIMLVGRAA